MPELPEVETICRGLQPHLEGRRILRVTVIERRLRCLVDRKLAQYLEGNTIVRVGRMAKYILIFLDSDAVWVFHLGMSGKLVHVDPETPKQKHDHILVSLDSRQELRRFEYVALGPDPGRRCQGRRAFRIRFAPGNHLGAETDDMCLSLTLRHNQPATR